MIPRLCHTSSWLHLLTRVHRDVRLSFSSSAATFVRKQPQRLSGDHPKSKAVDGPSRTTDDEAEENEPDADEKEEAGGFDKRLFAGKERVNESAIRSYQDPHGHFRRHVAPSFHKPSPRNWLGRDVPFPLNPSFKPPVPLSDEFRTRLYRAYMIDPNLNSVRALATRHNISVKRVDAILRLKGMEEAWKKAKPLQTGFTRGMEHLLGVKEAAKRAEPTDELLEDGHSEERESNDRYDVQEADLQDQVEGKNRARQRYQRLFWESVTEGEEPVMPAILEAQGGVPVAGRKYRGKTIVVGRAPGRPAIKFVDVGDAFVNQKDRERRECEGARRSVVKESKRIRELVHA